MDNINDRAIGSGFGILVFLMALISMTIFVTASLSMLRVSTEESQDRTALKMGRNMGNVEFEDQDAYVYRYEGEGSGDNIIAVSNGDSVTGASVFTEIQNLPDEVTDIYLNATKTASGEIIGTPVLVNYSDRTDQDEIGGIPNVAYYMENGLTDKLLDRLETNGMNPHRIYVREYEFDSSGAYGEGRITGINYVPEA